MCDATVMRTDSSSTPSEPASRRLAKLCALSARNRGTPNHLSSGETSPRCAIDGRITSTRHTPSCEPPWSMIFHLCNRPSPDSETSSWTNDAGHTVRGAGSRRQRTRLTNRRRQDKHCPIVVSLRICRMGDRNLRAAEPVNPGRSLGRLRRRRLCHRRGRRPRAGRARSDPRVASE